MRAPRPSISLLVLGFALAANDGALAETKIAANKERRFFSAREGIGIDAPTGWTLSRHTGYPTVLVTLVHPGGSRISLAADRTKAADARALAEESRPGLAAQGFAVDRVQSGPHGGVRMEARAVKRRQAIRQLYLVRAIEGVPELRQALVITLTVPDDQIAAASGPFDWVLGHLTLETPMPAPSSPRPDRPGDGGA